MNQSRALCTVLLWFNPMGIIACVFSIYYQEGISLNCITSHVYAIVLKIIKTKAWCLFFLKENKDGYFSILCNWLFCMTFLISIDKSNINSTISWISCWRYIFQSIEKNKQLFAPLKL